MLSPCPVNYRWLSVQIILKGKGLDSLCCHFEWLPPRFDILPAVWHCFFFFFVFFFFLKRHFLHGICQRAAAGASVKRSTAPPVEWHKLSGTTVIVTVLSLETRSGKPLVAFVNASRRHLVVLWRSRPIQLCWMALEEEGRDSESRLGTILFIYFLAEDKQKDKKATRAINPTTSNSARYKPFNSDWQANSIG